MTGLARIQRRWAVMGTVFTLDIRTRIPEPELAQPIGDAFAWLVWVDETFSTYQSESEVSRLQRGTLALEACHPEVQAIWEACQGLKEVTEGYFDAWGGPGRAFDPSGLVKGWAAERASEMLTRAGAANHCLNAAGDVALAGRPGPGELWRVGIAHPLQARALTTVVALASGAVATSGTSERGEHIYNPHTGRPATELASVTVIGPSLSTADAYATAALAMGLDAPVWLTGLEGYEAYVMDARGHVWSSRGFPAYQVA